jgi:hypothetical protein
MKAKLKEANMDNAEAIRQALKPEVSHTPTPWKLIDKTVEASEWDGCSKLIADLDNVQIWGPLQEGGSYPENRANGAFIVRAVNAYEGLLKSAKLSLELFSELRRTMDEGHWFADDLKKIGDSLSATIAKAEGK